MTWSEFVRRTARGDNQVAIEARTSITQGTVSRWLKGEVLPQPAQAAKFAQSYGANVLEAFVAAGFLTEEEAGIPPTPKTSFEDLIDSDPSLSPEAKVHIKNQYGLLKAASAANRQVLLREQIERNTNLDPETKAQLLATLAGDGDAAVADVSVRIAERDVVRQYPRVVQEAARGETGNEPPSE